MKKRAREDPKKGLKKWGKGYSYSKDYEKLDDVVEDVLVNQKLQGYLQKLLDFNTGLRLGMVSYKDFANVQVTYGLALSDEEDSLGTTTLYFNKDPHITLPYDDLGEDLRFSHRFLRADWETGQEFYGVPKVSTFVNALNNSLQHPHNKREKLFEYHNE
ncbi:hypothetical protein KY327_02800 [Candidatus Woesearchaeota archaeon]|nr:hypothetical protein [Candidatus Woesearchaeota archaeon]